MDASKLRVSKFPPKPNRMPNRFNAPAAATCPPKLLSEGWELLSEAGATLMPGRSAAKTGQRFNVLLVLAIAAVSSPLYAHDITLQDNVFSVSFDSDSGALTRFENKNPHWMVERRPELGASFRLFAPLPTRRYNPVFGQKQPAAEVRKVSDNEINLRWENLVSENGGVLPMSFAADIMLTNGQLTFGATLKNDSGLTVETIDYPYFGDLNPPSRDSTLTAYTMKNGHLQPDELYPHFRNEKGYWGVTWPTKMLEPQNSHYCLIRSPDAGFSIGTPTPPDYRMQYVFEQHPGVISGITALVPPEDEISGVPVYLEFRVCHFVFAGPHSTKTLAPVVLVRLNHNLYRK